MRKSKRLVSSMLLMLLLINMAMWTFNIQSANANDLHAKRFTCQTIYIRVDGSIDPPTVPIRQDGNVYTFTDDISGSIVVQKDSIVIDGNGHILQGNYENIVGIDLTDRKQVTIRKLIIKGFSYGVQLFNSYNNTLTNNTFTANNHGVWFSPLYWARSGFNNISANVFTNNTGYAIHLIYSDYCILTDNQIENNEYGIYICVSARNVLKRNSMKNNRYDFGIYSYSNYYYFMEYFFNDVDKTNTVNNKPIYYWINRSDATIPYDAGQVVIVNSTNIRVKNLALEKNIQGIALCWTRNSIIENVTVTNCKWGISLWASEGNIIRSNYVSNNFDCGILLEDSDYNLIADNTVIKNMGLGVTSWAGGIYLEDTEGNILRNNLLINNTQGIGLDDSYNIEVIGNNLIGNYHRGIMLGNLHNGIIAENNLISNQIGIWLIQQTLPASIIFHNNFINNSIQTKVQTMATPHRWDNGYPSGGNYWSNYIGWDANDDGIGDLPYVIDENNQDRYPLMSPYGAPRLPTYILTITATIGGTTNPPTGNYKHSKGQNIPVTAAPSSGYIFDHWELDGFNIGAINPVSITMNTNHTLQAVFQLAFTLTLTTTAGGTTNPAPGTLRYVSGTIVSVTAIALTGYCFEYWLLDGTPKFVNPINVTMNMNHTLRAMFASIEYTLTITSTDGGTTLPVPGQHAYKWGTIASITALPNTGYYLDHWELDGVNIGISNPVNFTMHMNHTIHAVFRQLSSGHNVVIKWITSKTVVGQGFFSSIQVTAVNMGSYPETFNVTVYVNMTVMALQTITLESGAFETLTIIWNTSGWAKGNYNITAHAWPVPDEANTTDNTYITANIIVAMIGDISSPSKPNVPDGKVDMADIGATARLFGVAHPNPQYSLNCDITGPITGLADGKIDMMDIGTVARHFGETDP